ncbi:MAG: BON domain-containing protein [Pseudotabrizicola sp.]|uniref:BON domain-containing protein n=1 Tax=Pseudotabrizicola sp. TaxID=2939647 RepID=UPI00271734DD|nr:BON domain-containing protein [Pseudotabrizicola sp.]MDO9640578.1 BON domain-containing protein [Pseudotabrizicola sp.]
MPTYTRTSAFTSAITIAVAAMSSVVSADTSSQQIIDARRETQVWRAYAQSQYLRANTLEVSVLNGKATLTGRVEGQLNKYLAKLIALGVEGVVEVDNQIVVHTAPSLLKPSNRPEKPAYIADQAPSGSWTANLDKSSFSTSHAAADSGLPDNRDNNDWSSADTDNPEQRTPAFGRAQDREAARDNNREGFKF